MVEVKSKLSSHRWWFDSHNTSSPKRSPWLHSTLSELDEKTKAMLKLIEEDADSFAQRAEMYYKKRPELINMVEDFYRAHRSLAERYDQIKSDPVTRLLTPWVSPLSFTKYRSEKLMSSMDKSYDSYSEIYDPEESGESDVEDPEQEEVAQIDEEIKEEEASSGICTDKVGKLRDEIERLKEDNKIQKEQLMQKDEEKRQAIRQLSLAVDALKEENSQVLDPEQEEVAQLDQEIKEEEVSSGICTDEVVKLRDEIERLKEDNKIQKEQLMQKDEEKREAIRQLSLAVDVLKEENAMLRNSFAKKSPNKWSPLEFNKIKELFWGKMFNECPHSQQDSM